MKITLNQDELEKVIYAGLSKLHPDLAGRETFLYFDLKDKELYLEVKEQQ